MARKVTLAHGPDGYIVQAIATGFDLEHGDMALLDDIQKAVEERTTVLAFANDIEVEHIFEPEEQA